jgi:hypothetical protein
LIWLHNSVFGIPFALRFILRSQLNSPISTGIILAQIIISCGLHIVPMLLALRCSYTAWPIISELACKLCRMDWTWKYVKYKMMNNKNNTIMSSATVRGQYPNVGSIFDPF